MSSIIFATLISLVIVANVFTAPLVGISLGSEASLTLEQNGDLFEGDIVLPPLKARSLVMTDSNVRWPNGIVPYEISSSYSNNDKTAIVNAMRQLENYVAINNVRCVQFRPRQIADTYYITIINGSGCSSHVGRHTDVVMNRTVSLQSPGCIYSGIIMHELLHTLGFLHEQSRPDRDSYVQINSANIESNLLSQFTKYDTTVSSTQNKPYDYHSVMHYPKNAFTTNGLPTIEPLQANVKIGQRYFLSSIDIAAIRTFYSCSGMGTTLPPPTISTTDSSVITSTYSSALTSADPSYTRPNGPTGSYYYESIDVTVPTAGAYTFQSNNDLDTYASIYQYDFNASDPSANLLLQTDDLSQSNWNFEFILNFQYSLPVTVVVTTYSPNAQGPFTLLVTGPSNITFVRKSP